MILSRRSLVLFEAEEPDSLPRGATGRTIPEGLKGGPNTKAAKEHFGRMVKHHIGRKAWREENYPDEKFSTPWHRIGNRRTKKDPGLSQPVHPAVADHLLKQGIVEMAHRSRKDSYGEWVQDNTHVRLSAHMLDLINKRQGK